MRRLQAASLAARAALAAPLVHPSATRHAADWPLHAALVQRCASSQAAARALAPLLPPQAHRDAAAGTRLRGADVCRGWAAGGLPSAAARFAKEAPPPGTRSGVTPPASVSGLQRGGVRVVMFSPNVIAEPYTGPPKSLGIASLFTAAGWRERWKRVLGRVKNVYALAKVKKDVPNWTLPAFKADACELYTDVCAAIAAGDAHALRHKVTESLLADIKRELKQRDTGGWKRVEWTLEAVEECAVVHGRLVAPNPKDTTLAWAQLTVALRSTQRFAAYDARGKLVAGNPGQAVRVQDYWVLERSLLPNTPDGLKRWRAAARLTLPPVAA